MLGADLDQEVLQRGLILEVALLLVALHLVERRQRNVEVAALDELPILAIEECEEQRPDVRPVDVGVGHDDDAGG